MTMLLITAVVDRLMMPVNLLLIWINNNMGHLYSPFSLRIFHLLLVNNIFKYKFTYYLNKLLNSKSMTRQIVRVMVLTYHFLGSKRLTRFSSPSQDVGRGHGGSTGRSRHIAMSYGFAIWICHMALSYGISIRHSHVA